MEILNLEDLDRADLIEIIEDMGTEIKNLEETMKQWKAYHFDKVKLLEEILEKAGIKEAE